MLMAARSMQAASRVLWMERETRGLTPSTQADPNRTGMIGQEYTPITTTIGELAAKRTATNPDFAAALVRQIASLRLARGTPVVIVVSGSFVGGDVAAITATETLGLRPIVIASLSASMWGANEPEFNLIDMLAALRKMAAEQGKDPAKVTLERWTIHDLRRTAKTLMARAGVRPDISERVLGHVIAGVEGTYDRHSYADEKRDALEKLAATITRILSAGY